MSFNFHTSGFDATTYQNKRLTFIQYVEEGGHFSRLPYNDGKGLVTIGLGFNLHDPAVRSLVLAKMGITDADLVKDLSDYMGRSQDGKSNDQIQKDLNAYMPTGKTFGFTSDTQIIEIFQGTDGNGGLVKKYEDILDSWAKNHKISVIPKSNERLALLSLAYNGGLGNGLATAIANNQRAEAWYEIRYNTNGGSNEALKQGQAKRRYYESQLFGLYEDESSVTPEESKQTFLAFTNHRIQIVSYESTYQAQIDLANKDFLLNNTVNEVTDLLTNLDKSKPALIKYLEQQYETELNAIDLSTFSSLAIQLGGSGQDVLQGQALTQTVNSVSLSYDTADLLVGEEGADTLYGRGGNDVLIGGSGDDFLEGGTGNDTLIGGEGVDTYIWNAGDHDRIIDSDGQGWIRFKSANGTTTDISLAGAFIQTTASGSQWNFTLPNGDIAVLSHNSPWKITMPDGSILELGEDFEDGDYGISLKKNTTINPATTLDILGDLKPIDFDANTAGVQMRYDALGNPLTSGSEPDRADVLYDSTGNDHISLGDGNDLTYLARGGDNWIQAGNGDDFVAGDGDVSGNASGKDVIEGNSGADILISGANDDAVYGGDKIDLSLAITQGTTQTSAGSKGDWLDGGAGNDTLIGTGTADLLLGGAGSDMLVGAGGDDTFYGDEDGGYVYRDWSILREVIQYSDHDKYRVTANRSGWTKTAGGNDIVYGGAGNDWIMAGSGDDIVDGGNDNDAVFGDDGNDVLDGGNGKDVLAGGNGNDYLSGGDGDDKLSGADYDTLAELGRDTLDGGSGDDTLSGNGGDDWLKGGAGNDGLLGDDGNDQLNGMDGDDTLQGGNGNDTLDGGTDDDSLLGDAGDDALYGSNGNDYLEGNEGNDTLTGGLGADNLKGGGGNDTYLIDSGDSLVSTEGFTETIDDTEGNNIVKFGAGMNATGLEVTVDNSGQYLVVGSVGSDLLFIKNGMASAIQQYQFANGDTLNTADMVAKITGSFSAFLTNTTGDFAIYGGNGNATLYTGSGNNLLDGQGGNDYLNGGTGNDTLTGGTGNDSLSGGDGTDTYLFGIGDGQDYINNYDYDALGVNTDSILLGAGITASGVSVRRQYDNLLLSINGTSDTLTISSYFYQDAYALETIKFVDGTNWNITTVQAKVLVPTAGNDNLIGYNGADTLDGGAGNDNLSGGNGADTYLFGKGGGTDSISNYDDDALNTNADSIQLGAGITTGDATVIRQYDDLLLSIKGSSDSLRVKNYFQQDAASPYAVENIKFADGTTWNITTVKAKVLIATAGNDSITGYATNDNISGGDGNDSLYGNAGNDTLSGGAGNDTLSGGNGADTYLFGRGGGADIITNDDNDEVNTNADTIQLGAGITTGDVTVISQNNYLLLRINGSTDSLQVNNYFQQDAASSYAVENIKFADGTNWDINTVKAKVLIPTSGNDSITGYATNDSISGGDGNDSLHGNAGNDTLNGDGGDDYVSGGAGNDYISGGAGSDNLSGGVGADVYLFGIGSGQDRIINYDNDELNTNADTIQLGAGITTSSVSLSRNYDDLNLIINGTTDKLVVSNYFSQDGIWPYTVEIIKFADGTSWDIATVKAKVLIGTAGNDTISGYSTNDIIDGGDGNDVLYGYDGADTLIGGIGYDTLSGGIGSDTYKFGIGSGHDIINNADGDAYGVNADTIELGVGITSANINLGHYSNTLSISLKDGSGSLTINDYFMQGGKSSSALENIKFVDGSVWNSSTVMSMLLQSTAGNDSLLAFDSNDTLDGGLGNDTLTGGLGNDTYVYGVGYGKDVIVESGSATAETDTVALAAGIIPANVSLFRDESDLVLVLNNSSTQLRVAGHFITAGGYPDYGSADNSIERITFADGTTWNKTDIANKTSSGTANVMTGAAGNDIYLVDNSGDTISEAANAGTDTVNSSVSYWLPDNVENLTATGLINSILHGNNLDNIITGNASDNILNIGSGIYRNIYYSDSYRLEGDDTLIGGKGDDAYYVNGLKKSNYFYNERYLYEETNDTVIELANEGNDKVYSNTFNYTLPENVEILTDQYTNGTRYENNEYDVYVARARSLKGNTGNNTISVEGGRSKEYLGTAIVIDGGLGADTMVGSYEDTTYVIDHAGDVVRENSLLSNGANNSIDTISASITYDMTNLSDVENITLTGLNNINGTGNAFNNVLTGNAGNNQLKGGAGNDTYLFSGSFGQDTVNNYDTATGKVDAIQFSSDIGPALLNVTRSGNDLILAITNNSDRVTVTNYFLNNGVSDYKVEQIKFSSNGETWDYAKVASKAGVVTNTPPTATNLSTAETYTEDVALNLTDIVITDSDSTTHTATLTLSTTAAGRLNTATAGGVTSTYNATTGVWSASGATTSINALLSGLTLTPSLNYNGNFTIAASISDGFAPVVTGNKSFTGTAVNDAPTAINQTVTTNEDTVKVFALSDFGFSDVDASNTLQSVTISSLPTAGSLRMNGVAVTVNQIIMAANISSGLLSFTPVTNANGSSYASFGFKVSDGTVVSAAAYTMTLNVTAVNDAPTVNITIAAQQAVDGSSYSFTLPNNLFQDIDAGDQLSYGLIQSNGNALPGWLSFNSQTRTLSGKPGAVNIGTPITLKAVANDLDGASTFTTFSLLVNAMPNQTITGTTGNDSLTGGSGNDTLDGNSGSDTMTGGYGNDLYIVDNAGDIANETIGQGTDSVQSSLSHTLSNNVENLTLTGTTAINATGNSLNNVLTGNSGNNTLNGLVGADTLIGGIGNDIYIVDNIGDIVTEDVNAGTDSVQSSITYTLGVNIENLILTGTTAINGTGNSWNNTIVGNSAVNTLIGNAGDDTLDGGLGADSMEGGVGNDAYVVDNTGDVVNELANEGTDTVQSFVTYTLDTALEHLTLTGSAAINATGNASNNALTGNASNNILDGKGGDDTMVGGLGDDTYLLDSTGDIITELANQGNDTLQVVAENNTGSVFGITLGSGNFANIENLIVTGGGLYDLFGDSGNNLLRGNISNNTLTGNAGNDTLEGGIGNDTMIGGTGNDLYLVDSAADVISENANEGNDTIQVVVDYAGTEAFNVILETGSFMNVENLIVTAAGLYNLGGNTGNNWLRGNGSNNLLHGFTGNDLLQGMGGNDTLINVSGNTLLDAGLGNDSLTGGTGSDILIGGKGNDTITTDTGYDIISFNKGDGQDIVNASTGADNTISLGGSFTYSDLSLSKTGNDLLLKVGATDQITLKDWYGATANKSVINLQVIAEAVAGFSLGSSDALRDNKIENFDFANLVAAYDAAGNPANWALTDAILTTHLKTGSDTAALGGDLAYQYGRNGNLTDIGMLAAQNVINASTFGQSAQTLNSPTTWQAEAVKLG